MPGYFGSGDKPLPQLCYWSQLNGYLISDMGNCVKQMTQSYAGCRLRGGLFHFFAIRLSTTGQKKGVKRIYKQWKKESTKYKLAITWYKNHKKNIVKFCIFCWICSTLVHIISLNMIGSHIPFMQWYLAVLEQGKPTGFTRAKNRSQLGRSLTTIFKYVGAPLLPNIGWGALFL